MTLVLNTDKSKIYDILLIIFPLLFIIAPSFHAFGYISLLSYEHAETTTGIITNYEIGYGPRGSSAKRIQERYRYEITAEDSSGTKHVLRDKKWSNVIPKVGDEILVTFDPTNDRNVYTGSVSSIIAPDILTFILGVVLLYFRNALRRIIGISRHTKLKRKSKIE